MRVCYLGPFDPEYPRNKVIIKGLRKNGVEVIECNARSNYNLINYAKVLEKSEMLNYDVIMLGARGVYYNQPLMLCMKHFTKKPIVFDAMLTLYETEVIDRQRVHSESVKAKLMYLLDYLALRNANLVLSDTIAHAKYYSCLYNIQFNAFRRVFVGSDDETFYPRIYKKENDSFLVMFWGGFIPLQGVKYIIEAANLLKDYGDIKFELRGFGQTYYETLEISKSLGVKNITFSPSWIPYSELPGFIAEADVCLGIFGETGKAKRVVPNKAVEALAMRKSLITGDSPAAREVLSSEENCILVPMADPKAIANAILELKQNKKLRVSIAENGYQLFKEKFSPMAVGKELKSVLIEQF